MSRKGRLSTVRCSWAASGADHASRSDCLRHACCSPRSSARVGRESRLSDSDTMATNVGRSTSVHEVATTAPNPTSDVIRLNLLQELCTAVTANIAVSYDMLVDTSTGSLYCGTTVVHGASAAQRLFAGLEGHLFGKLDVGLDEAPPVNTWGLGAPDTIAPAIREAVWEPLGIHSAIGILVTDGDVLVGGVDLYRVGMSPPFDLADLATCQARRPDVDHALQVAAGLACPPRGGRTVVVNAKGAVLMASPGNDAERAALLEHCMPVIQQAGDHNTARVELILERERVQVTPLNTAEGEPAFLITARPLRLMSIPEAMRLSAVKRRVAALAAVGCTIDEIASDLKRSPHTVRTHLRKIYEDLGVANRVELQALVGEVWQRRPPT